MTGRLQRDIMVYAAVEPFIRATAQNRSHESLGENSDDEEAIQSRGGKDNTGKEKRRHIPSLEPEGSEVHRPLEGSNTTFRMTETVFVVRRINSFFSGGQNHVVFSVVGATAIFEFTLAETDDLPDIRHHDFGKPVIDFTVCGEGSIWVLLDADFPEGSNVADACPRKLVQAVRWSVDQFVDAGSSVLLDSLNTICSLPVAAEDLKALDLYSDLSSLPKCIDGEHGSHELGRSKPIRQPQPPENEPIDESASVAVGLTKRALGRLKHKRALDQLHHEKVGDHDISGPDTKKMRADSDNEDSRSM
ncbi:hypothetical protein J3R82DRAFT_2262 [Butyriboletus roseoflavus]|nr:hypothetical protein J3R82DRAFT_2262 [Butyriboletus roseoflavus]